ncbi:hypothetical protein BASA50_001664 [Batrachochytrium salamandrivorans]|uniref:P-type phospholipid transporter n=1 Tax=Batrachochytrium salamandrivorans TaxID=1357716 RepID=A0ABQ8FRH2_9FUNG|nr:hypothetical protein BASA50_001664 [Batrachochytrium salamandrivorans]
MASTFVSLNPPTSCTNTPATVDMAPLKTMVSDSLARRGVLASLKAQLRAAVFNTLYEEQGTHHSTLGSTTSHKDIMALAGSEKGRLALDMVREFLIFYKLEQTLLVFNPECGLDDARVDSAMLLKKSGLPTSTTVNKPVLLALIEASVANETRILTKMATPSTPPIPARSSFNAGVSPTLVSTTPSLFTSSVVSSGTGSPSPPAVGSGQPHRTPNVGSSANNEGVAVALQHPLPPKPNISAQTSQSLAIHPKPSLLPILTASQPPSQPASQPAVPSASLTVDAGKMVPPKPDAAAPTNALSTNIRNTHTELGQNSPDTNNFSFSTRVHSRSSQSRSNTNNPSDATGISHVDTPFSQHFPVMTLPTKNGNLKGDLDNDGDSAHSSYDTSTVNTISLVSIASTRTNKTSIANLQAAATNLQAAATNLPVAQRVCSAKSKKTIVWLPSTYQRHLRRTSSPPIPPIAISFVAAAPPTRLMYSLFPWRRTPKETHRRVFVNLSLPAKLASSDGTPLIHFPSNRIRTSKYTPLTFIPKNLSEQFRRAVPIFTVASTAWLPAIPLIVIISISAIKDLIEDSRRQASDKRLNQSKTLALSGTQNSNYPLPKKPTYKPKGDTQQNNPYDFISPYTSIQTDVGWVPITWDNLKVGDIVMISANESIPADLVLLASSDSTGIAFVETKNLDGETNLKAVEAIPDTAHLRMAEDCRSLCFVLESEPPNINLYSQSGSILVFPRPINPSTGLQSSDAMPLDAAKEISQNLGNMDTPLGINSKVYTGARLTPVNIQNILLRGSVLKNVDFVIGVVLFTGSDTKVVLNSGVTPSKRSNVEKNADIQVVINFVILVVLAAIIAINEGSAFKRLDQRIGILNYENIGIDRRLVLFGASIIMMQNIVPISLYVSLELMKSLQSYFIYQDLDMYDAEANESCIPKSWNITDDLGQIEFLFSDKTGTLTQNKMEFRRCTINGVVYGKGFTDISADQSQMSSENLRQLTASRVATMLKQMELVYVNPMMAKDLSFIDDVLFDDYTSNETQRRHIVDMFTILAVCHTVPTPVHHPTKMLLYSAQSPDEGALVSGAKDVGVTFERRELNKLFVNVFGQVQSFIVLHVLEFNSSRKRMSVIVRNEKQQLILMTKGADSIIYSRLAPGQEKDKLITLEHLSNFASEGLRTLCIAQRIISEEEYSEWLVIQREASVSLTDREQLLDAAAELIEQNLVLMGATAIEDRLQDGVPQTISTLREAGIRIWVLTGDKLETAINIGYSSNLLSKDMTLLVMSGTSMDEISYQIDQALGYFVAAPRTQSSVWNVLKAGLYSLINPIWRRMMPRTAARAEKRAKISQIVPPANMSFAMVIDGVSLEHALSNARLREMLLQLSVLCKSIICCRVSPKQKAQVVQLVQDGLGAMCLSIGDGANDVSMIQQAQVGVGIFGKEGCQAAQASDFVICQFRFLSKLLLVHGHWSYYRISESILNFFFKNIAWVVTLFWYQCFSGYTGIILFDYNYILLFNLIFTAAPPLLMGILDQDVSESQILAFPQIYKIGIAQYFFSFKRFMLFVVEATYQSFICYYFAHMTYGHTSSLGGYSSDRLVLGTAAAVNAIVVINITLALNIRSWMVYGMLAMFISSISFFIYVPVVAIFGRGSIRGVVQVLFLDPRLYLELVVTIVACLIPRVTLNYMRLIATPTDLDIVREIKVTGLKDMSSPESPAKRKKSRKAARNSIPCISTIDRGGSISSWSRTHVQDLNAILGKSDSKTSESDTIEMAPVRDVGSARKRASHPPHIYRCRSLRSGALGKPEPPPASTFKTDGVVGDKKCLSLNRLVFNQHPSEAAPNMNSPRADTINTGESLAISDGMSSAGQVHHPLLNNPHSPILVGRASPDLLGLNRRKSSVFVRYADEHYTEVLDQIQHMGQSPRVVDDHISRPASRSMSILSSSYEEDAEPWTGFAYAMDESPTNRRASVLITSPVNTRQEQDPNLSTRRFSE